MILEILSNLTLNRIEMLIRVLDGCILFVFISVFLTSVIINVKNRNLKSMLLSLIFIITYGLASMGTFFGIFILKKLNIPVNNTSYYIEIGSLIVIQIVMIVLMYIFADPFAREKKLENIKDTEEYEELLKLEEEKKENKLKNKHMRKNGKHGGKKAKIGR